MRGWFEGLGEGEFGLCGGGGGGLRVRGEFARGGEARRGEREFRGLGTEPPFSLGHGDGEGLLVGGNDDGSKKKIFFLARNIF